MLEQDQIQQVTGSDLYGSDGKKIGTVQQIYLDDQTGRPEWVTVKTGLIGSSESFVPLAEASFSGDRLSVPYDKDKVKDAPSVSGDQHLSPQEEQELYRYYGVGWGEYDTTTAGRTESYQGGRGETVSGEGGRGEAQPGLAGRGETDDAMTVSEDRVKIGTQQQEAGRARLRKYVVTEEETQTVPVRKERAVVEREPVTDANRDQAMSGPEISESEHEVTLREEQPVVEKETVPVERVRLGTEEVTDEETVTEQVRKERVEGEGDIADDDRGRRG